MCGCEDDSRAGPYQPFAEYKELKVTCVAEPYKFSMDQLSRKASVHGLEVKSDGSEGFRELVGRLKPSILGEWECWLARGKPGTFFY